MKIPFFQLHTVPTKPSDYNIFIYTTFDIKLFDQPLCFICFKDTLVCVGRSKVLDFKFRRVLNLLCILLGISPVPDCCMPTFRNTLSVPSS